MAFIKEYRFGEVQAFETGRGCLGRPPLVSAFSYMIDGVMIDTGIRHARREILQAPRLWRVEAIYLTHHHEDHSGNAAAMKGLWGTRVFGHPLCRQKMAAPFPILPYQRVLLGRSDPVDVEDLPPVIETKSLEILPIHAPGHSKDHVCYLIPQKGWLFSGDLFLGDRIKYFRSDENLGEQILSLKKIMALDFESLFCAHNPQPLKGKQCLASKLAFLEDLYGRIEALQQKGMNGRDIMSALEISESRAAKWMTMGNVSAANLVRSAMETASAGGPHSPGPPG